MSDSNVHEKALNEKGDGSDSSFNQPAAVYERPKGIRGFYAHPATQVSMLGLVCFMCPGMFNALNGLGGGGQLDAVTSANSNVALYSTFAFFAFFAGSINNTLGSRLTLFLGSLGYSLYIGSYLAMNIHPHAGAFVVASGAILGVCAGLLWAAQGSLMMAYPTEGQKGKYIGIFWSIFNLGAVTGEAVSTGKNWNSTSNAVSNGTYIGFLIITLIGVTLPLAMVDPRKMIRTDGTKVTPPRHPSWKTELYGLYLTLRTDPMVLLLFPMFFASNYFYTWQFNDYNGALFNIRTRSLNAMVYYMAQIVGSVAMGKILDNTKITRRIRAFTGWSILLGMVFVVHIWAYFYQKDYTRASTPSTGVKIDVKDHGYAAKVWLYIFCGLLDAMWQTAAYWMMGAMSNDPSKLAHFAGFYKSIQSAGAAGIWRADAVLIPYMNIFISTWALLVAGLFFMLPMIHLRVKNHTDLSDEVLARMDDEGHILPPEEVEAVLAAPKAAQA
ncbi:hypothetical protein PLICRDRAFT_172084 [Plicaturopsis crispa FD-325 SS-3]|nr:hypothetical protein PLICRDRAFT_172084 [Plicaturopsis crispa FD-325 SS-3]